MSDRITILAGGREWTAFEEISVEAAVDEAARSFSFRVAAEVGGKATAWAFRVGTSITVVANGTPICTGYVDRYRPRLRATEANATVTGRSKGADAIDCSAVHETGRFENKTPLDIAKDLDKFGIGFTVKGALRKLKQFQLTPGETVFRAIERLARAEGFNLRGKGDGGIEIWNAASPSRQAGPIIEGQNLLSGDADHNGSGRHSHYHVRGQSPWGHSDDDLEIEAVAKDQGVDRYRPIIVVQEDDTDKTRAKGRAKTRRDRAAGRSLSASIEVQGLTDPGGTLWEPGNLVYLESPYLDIQQDMLIEHVTYSQSGSGTITRLALVDPRAHGGKKGKGSKSGEAWSATYDDPE